MLFTIAFLARPADSVDFSDLTTAVRTGPAMWTDTPNVLDIPFDRDLTPAEVAAITLRLTSDTINQEQLRKQAKAYLALAAPTNAQNVAAIKGLIRLVGHLVDRSDDS